MKNLFHRLIVSLVVLMGVVNSAPAQDIHFSQFYLAPLQQNPAMAGAIYGIEATINYKDQWRAIGAPYKTFSLTYDMRFVKKRVTNGFLAGGVNFINDKAGDSKMGTTQGNFNLAYHVKLADYHTLGLGVQSGFFQRSINYGGLQWGNQYDGMEYNGAIASGESQGSSVFTRYDMGAGIAWAYNNTAGDINVTDNHDLNFNAGFSVFHLTRPRYSFAGTNERLYMKYVLHGNGVISLPDTKMAFVPGFMYYRQGPAQEILVGSLVRYLLTQDSKFTGYKNASAFYIGAYWRTRDALSAQLLYEYAGWGFGLSYDINTSSLREASYARGGLEISIRFNAPNSKGAGAYHSRY